MRSTRQGCERNMTKKCAILFSGGLDSSFASCLMIEQGYDIELLNMDHGALISNNLPVIRHQELVKAYPQSNITLYHINIAGAFRAISLASIEKDILTHKVNLVCVGCKLAMHARAITYCLQNDIKVVADGSTKRQERYGEQRKMAIEHIKSLYEEYGIDYVNPVYNYEKTDIKYGMFDRGLTIQPLEDTCLFSKTFSNPEDDAIDMYISGKVDIFKTLIERSISYEKNR